MGDMGDYFRDYTVMRREKRRSNTENSTELLRQQGIPFESRNGGAHLVVDGVADFWPSTGLFIPRDRTYSRDRGVSRLLDFVRARRLDRVRAVVSPK
jgi:hypothetical protein